MKERLADRCLPDVPQPQPGPKWLSMSPRDRRKWEDKQWTDPDGDYDGPPLIHPPLYKPSWYQSILGVLGLLGLILGPVLLAALHRHVSDRELEFGSICYFMGACLVLFWQSVHPSACKRCLHRCYQDDCPHRQKEDTRRRGIRSRNPQSEINNQKSDAPPEAPKQ